MVTFLDISIILLAAIFAIVGYLKLNKNKKTRTQQFKWIRDFKPATITFISFVEIFSAIGFIGPILIKSSYFITHYVAIGVCILMVLAGIYHSRKKEFGNLLINLIIFILALIIAIYYKR